MPQDARTVQKILQSMVGAEKTDRGGPDRKKMEEEKGAADDVHERTYAERGRVRATRGATASRFHVSTRQRSAGRCGGACRRTGGRRKGNATG